VRVQVLYWELVLAEHQLGVAGSALDVSLEQLDRDRRRKEAGVATLVEVIQDEATVSRRIEGVLLAETALRSAMDLLRSTLFPGVGAQTWSVRLRTITPWPAVSAAPRAGVWQAEIDAALGRRAEVRLSQLDLDIAKVQHERALSERQPFLDLLLQLSSQGYDASVRSSVEEALSYDFPSISAGLKFQLPMRNLARDNEERAARAELRGAGLALDAVRSSVAADLREALRQIRYQAEATRAALKTREAAQRLMEAEQSRYEQGLATNFQVLQFQQGLVEAQYAEHVTRAAYGKAWAILSGSRGLAGEVQGAETP
jgi:outer membrane protein TolC